MMVYSEPGVGKTHFVGTANEHPMTEPLLVLDIDGGVSTLRKFAKKPDVKPIRSTDDLIKMYRDLYNAIPSDGSKYPYGTIAIDTFSELQQLNLRNIMKQFAKINDKIDADVPDQRGYGKSGTQMRDILRVFRDLPCNTIFSCHSKSDRDNNMRLVVYPALVGQLRIQAPGFLDIVGYYRMESDGDGVKRLMQFQGTETAIAKDRLGAFDAVEVNPTIPMLWDKLQSANKGESK